MVAMQRMQGMLCNSGNDRLGLCLAALAPESKVHLHGLEQIRFGLMLRMHVIFV
jgi:hypothetical protein